MPAWPRVTVANQLFTVTEQAEGRGWVQVTKGARGTWKPGPRPPAPSPGPQAHMCTSQLET